jgi:uncharacterized protein
LVLARSAFHHSMNYRSVVILGRATAINSDEEKLAALFALSEHMIPGRWADVREPNQRELDLTTVLFLPIREASAKVRTGPPLDDEQDYDLPIWAGVIPLELKSKSPIEDPRLQSGVIVPVYAEHFARRPRS